MNLKNSTPIISEIIKKSFSDFFSIKFLTLSIAPTIIILAIVFGIYHLIDIDFATLLMVDASTHPYLHWILSIGFVSWLINALLYIFIWGLLIVVSVSLGILIVGFFTPIIVKELHKKYYLHIRLTNQNFTFVNSLGMYFKVFFIFFTLLILTAPLIFVPGLNFVFLYVPFYYLFHHFLILDVGSCIVSKEEFLEIVKKNKLLFNSTTFSLYMISLIPFLGILLQVFFVIVIAHEFFIKKQEMQR